MTAVEDLLKEFADAVAADYDQLVADIAAAAGGSPDDATTAVKGIVRLGTLTEHTTGTSEALAATLAGVRQEINASEARLRGGVGPAFDTLNELYALAQAGDDTAAIADLVTEVGLKANSADVYTKAEIDTKLGDLDFDLAAYYQAAKA